MKKKDILNWKILFVCIFVVNKINDKKTSIENFNYIGLGFI